MTIPDESKSDALVAKQDSPPTKVERKKRGAQAELARKIFEERLSTPVDPDPRYTLSGPMTLEEIRDRMRAMVAMARAEIQESEAKKDQDR